MRRHDQPPPSLRRSSDVCAGCYHRREQIRGYLGGWAGCPAHAFEILGALGSASIRGGRWGLCHRQIRNYPAHASRPVRGLSRVLKSASSFLLLSQTAPTQPRRKGEHHTYLVVCIILIECHRISTYRNLSHWPFQRRPPHPCHLT